MVPTKFSANAESSPRPWLRTQRPRTSILNVVYSKDEARERVMETLAWSINALGFWATLSTLLSTLSFINIVKIGMLLFFFCALKTPNSLGTGRYPSTDPWGQPFSPNYNKHRYEVAGELLFPNEDGIVWRGIMEGIQADQDFLRLMLHLTRTASHQHFCLYCDAIQWLSLRHQRGPENNVESLYTIYGPREGDTQRPGKRTRVFNFSFPMSSFWDD